MQRFSLLLLFAASMLLPLTAFASGGGVRFSYQKVDLGGKTEWVLMPIAVNGLGGKVNATKLKTAFELLRKDKRGSYGASKITVTGAPPKAKVSVTIDKKTAKYATIVMAETVYTLTELGVSGVSFPGFTTKPFTRKDVAFPAYSLTVPLYKAVGRFSTPSVQVRMPDGSLVPSSSIAQKWKSKDAGLRGDIYSYLNSPDSFTVKTVAKLLPELKMSYATQVAALLSHKTRGVRSTALKVLEAKRNDKAVLQAVAKLLGKEKDAKLERAAARFLGKSKNKSYSVLELYYLLNKGSDNEKLESTKALGQSKDKRTARMLAPMLVAKNSKIAGAAAASLARIESDAEQLAALKKKTVKDSIRLDIARDLAKDKTPASSIAGLIYVANHAPDFEAVDALEALGAKKSDESRKRVESFLSAKKSYLRAGSLAVLETLGSADSIGPIAKAMKGSDEAAKLEEAGYRLMLKQSLSTVLAKTKDSDKLVQRMAYRAVGERAQKEKGGGKAFAALQNGVKSSDPLVRGAAARAIGTFANKEAEKILKGLVKDKSGAVRADVAFGIGYLKGGALAKELEAFLDDGEPDAQAAAMLSLAKRGEAGPWKKINSLAGAREPQVRAAAMTALAKLVARDDKQGVNQVVSKLSGAVTDKSLAVREAAINALGTFNNDKAVTSISLQAGAEEESIRITAIKALANTKNADAVAVIEDRLLDQNRNVREAAIVALGRLKAKAALKKHAGKETDKGLVALINKTLKKL